MEKWEANPRMASALWSHIAEPGDRWGGALRAQMGVVESMRWVFASFTAPPAQISGPGGREASPEGWRSAHRRWRARLGSEDWRSDLEQLDRLGGRLVTPEDSEWPAGLTHLEDREPPALWVLGNAPLTAAGVPRHEVAIVGSRAATQYGTKIAGQIAFDLSENGALIISGGAYGIDSAAHRGALDAQSLRDLETRDGGESGPSQGGVPTVAIVCGGLNSLYPPGNKNLFQRILDGGGHIVAEVPPAFRPARWRFLERNRLIAAWAQVTVVVEAGARSGALATANRAGELGREVAAVPGPVTSASSVGPHILLREGAALVEDALDVLALLDPTRTEDLQRSIDESPTHSGLPGITPHMAQSLHSLSPLAKRVWEALPLMGDADAERVAQVAGVSGDEAGSGLLTLHLAGLAHCEGNKWRRVAA